MGKLTLPRSIKGTSWWHSHYSGQYMDGLTGRKFSLKPVVLFGITWTDSEPAMVIYGPQHVPFDVDLGPVMLHDWRHISYEDEVAEVKNVRLNDVPSTEVGSAGPILPRTRTSVS